MECICNKTSRIDWTNGKPEKPGSKRVIGSIQSVRLDRKVIAKHDRSCRERDIYSIGFDVIANSKGS